MASNVAPSTNISVRRISNPTGMEFVSYVDLFTSAFTDDDPGAVAFTGNDRLGIGRIFLEANLQAAFIAGEVYGAFSDSIQNPDGSFSGGTLAGIAVWYSPGKNPFDTPAEKLCNTKWLQSMPAPLKSWWDYFSPAYAEFDTRVLGAGFRTNSYYLHFLGVHPLFHKRGIARAILKPIFERAYQEQQPLLVRTTRALNIGIYERLGFQLRGEQSFRNDWGDITIYLLVKDVDETSRHQSEVEDLLIAMRPED